MATATAPPISISVCLGTIKFRRERFILSALGVTCASSGAENAVGTGGRATRPAIRVPCIPVASRFS